jgi:hypothetical protein
VPELWTLGGKHELNNMDTSKKSDVVKSDKWTHDQLHDQAVTFQHQSGPLVQAKFTAVRCGDGMRVLVSYGVSRVEAAVRPVTQQEMDKIQLYPDGPTKFKMF